MNDQEWIRAEIDSVDEMLESGHFDVAGDLIKDMDDKGFHQVATQCSQKLLLEKQNDYGNE